MSDLVEALERPDGSSTVASGRRAPDGACCPGSSRGGGSSSRIATDLALKRPMRPVDLFALARRRRQRSIHLDRIRDRRMRGFSTTCPSARWTRPSTYYGGQASQIDRNVGPSSTIRAHLAVELVAAVQWRPPDLRDRDRRRITPSAECSSRRSRIRRSEEPIRPRFRSLTHLVAIGRSGRFDRRDRLLAVRVSRSASSWHRGPGPPADVRA